MNISWIKCLPIKNKCSTEQISITSDEIRKLISESMVHKNGTETIPKMSNKHNFFVEEDKNMKMKNSPQSKANTISEANLSNVFETNPDMVRASSFRWPDIEMDHLGCTGHECLEDVEPINRKILYQKSMLKMKPKFTPPVFSETGIAICPDPVIDVVSEKKRGFKHHSSVLEDDILYKTPGNMEFIEYTYPIIGHKWRYTTYAVPNNRNDWEWIYNYIKSIKNSFRRKYLCELLLCSEPGKYKGHIAYLVRLESETQGHILQCRSGLPKCLKDILVVPVNAFSDIECFVSEYLIKRKYVFKTIRSYQKEDVVEPQAIGTNLPIKIHSTIESTGDERTGTVTKTKSDSTVTTTIHTGNPVDLKTIRPPFKKLNS